MQRFTHFSRHAFERLSQRARLSCEEAALSLDQGLHVCAGRVPGFDREHLVFYSPRDQTCFVAIRDARTGTVVTILPLDYHARIAWPISEEACKQARQLSVSAQILERESERDVPSQFLISAVYQAGDGAQKTKVLIKTPSAPHGNDTRRFLVESPLFSQIPSLATSRAIDESTISSLLVRLGNRAEPIIIEYPTVI